MAKSKVSDAELIRIRNELAAADSTQPVAAWMIRDKIKVELGEDLHVSTIRGRFVAMGQPLSNGGMAKVGNPTPSVIVNLTPKQYQVHPELECYIPKDEEFVGYVEREVDNRLFIHYRAGKYPICQGPQGTGKTYGHMYFAWKNKLPFLLFSCYEDFNLVHLFGDKTIREGTIVFQESLFVKAIQGPSVICFDEINALSNQNTFDFHAFLQNRKLYIKDANDGKGKVFDIHPDCYVGFAQNPRSAKYIGGNIKSSAFLGRCTYITYPEFTKKEVTQVISKRFQNLSHPEVDEFIKFYIASRDTIKNNAMPIDISIRQLINIIDLWQHGMKLETALDDGLISVFDSISQPKAKESFTTLAEGTWKSLMDIKRAQMASTLKPPPSTHTTVTPNSAQVLDMNGNPLSVGDKVKVCNKPVQGTIRFIGMLDGKGTASTIWSEWDQQPWDGQLLSTKNGGMLRWTVAVTTEKIK